MQVRVIKEGWSEPSNGYTTFEVLVLYGAIKTGSVMRASRCVHVENKGKWVEDSVKQCAGEDIVQRLSEQFRKTSP